MLNSCCHHAKFDTYHIYSVQENCNNKVFATYRQSLHRLTFFTWVRKECENMIQYTGWPKLSLFIFCWWWWCWSLSLFSCLTYSVYWHIKWLDPKQSLTVSRILCLHWTNSNSPSRIGTDSLLSEASEKELRSRLSLELLRWWRRRRKKLRLADPDPLRDPLSSSESPRLQLSEWLRLSTISSSRLRMIIYQIQSQVSPWLEKPSTQNQA